MKKLLLTIAVFTVLLVCTFFTASALDWTLTSPGGNITAYITLPETGTTARAITWRAELEGREVLHPSPVGIYTAYADFRDNLYYNSETRAVIDETYPMVSGKFSTYINKANELTIRVSRASGSNTRYINYIFRAYDDGVAVRYHIEGSGTTTNSNANFESTGLQLLSTDYVNVMPYQRSYETLYSEFTGFSGMTNANGYNMPVLVRTALGDHLLFTEADMNARYVGATLRRPSDAAGVMQVRPNNEQGSTNVNISLPFTSPWRVAVIGTLADINETMLIENLNPPSQIADTSWIGPGITSWAWLTRSSYPQNSKQTWIDQIDFAAEIGWKYVLMDDGWQPNAWSSGSPINVYYDWFDEVMEYANEKGVGLLAWVHQSRLNTPAKRELLKEWAAKGIKGIKTDFFDSEAQSMMQVYDDITKAAADAKLIVNYHGANKPTGERRTWPNLLAKEGVYGAEQSSTTAAQDCIYPFTRNAVGPMDFTPLQDPWFSASNYTTAHNTGLAITVECGIQCLADYPNAYLNSPARDFFYKMPCAWDETVCIGAVIRQLYGVARRSGDTWYAGIVNNAARTENIKLDFLGDGTWYALVIREGASRNALRTEIVEVTKDSVISFQMGASSGGAMKITKTVPFSMLEQTIQAAKLELSKNASNIERYISIRAAGAVLSAEVGQKEALLGTSISLEELTNANNELLAAIQVFRQAVADSGIIGLRPPWYVRYPLTGRVTYNSAASATIYGEAGEFYDPTLTNRKDVQNLHLIDIPNAANVTIEVDLAYNPTANYQAAGLVFMRYSADASASLSDDFSINTAMKRYHSSFGNRCFMYQNRTGSGNAAEGGQVAAGAGACKLRITKTNNSFQAAFSENGGSSWTNIGTAQTNANLSVANSSTIRVGVFTYRGGAASIPATFSDFKINGVIQPFVEDYITRVDDVRMEITLGTPPELPATVTAYSSFGSQRQIAVDWEEVGPDKYNSRGTFVVYGKVEGTNMYAIAYVTTSVKAADSYLILANEDEDLNYLLLMATYYENGKMFEVVSTSGVVKAGESALVSIEIDKLNGHTVKTFLWDSITYVPIVLRADNTALKAAIAEAQKISLDGYTRLSVDGMQNLINEAVAVTKDSLATPADISSMISKLRNPPLKRRYLTGTPFGLAGSWNDSGQTFHMVFDGDINTFFDHGTATAYAGIDLGAGNASVINYIRYYPRIDDRQDIVNRLRGATIRGSNTLPSNSTNAGSTGTILHTVPTASNLNLQWYTVTSSDTTTAYRYLWIYNINFYGNISELEFWVTNPAHSDVTLLEDRVAHADSLAVSNYTPVSWSAMQTALTAAKALSGTSAQSAVDSAAQNLKTALEQLVPA